MREIIQPGAYAYSFDRTRTPICTVDSGETVCILTQDAFGDQLNREDLRPADLSGYINPVTGPIRVEGAQPGDCLKISILDISPTRDWGVSALAQHFGGLVGTASTPMLHPPLEERTWIYRRQEDGGYRCSDRLRAPWRPFIGTIATAQQWESPSSVAPGPMGGNMDVKDTAPGNVLYLPVYTEGAYLYVGDCHAAQGDGELCGVALEISARVTLKLEVLKNKKILWPRIESPIEIMTVGSAKPMEDAARIAYQQLIVWMSEEYQWDPIEAYQMLSLRGKMYVGNMVDTYYSMVAKIEKALLSPP